MKWLINRPPLFYLTAYILTIVGFATGYTFMPNNFYQNTRHLEKYTAANGDTQDKLTKAISDGIEHNIKLEFLLRNNTDSVIASDDSVFFHIGDFRVTNLVSDGNKIDFSVFAIYYVYQNPHTAFIKLSTDLQTISSIERGRSLVYDGEIMLWKNFTVEESTEPAFPFLLFGLRGLISDSNRTLTQKGNSGNTSGKAIDTDSSATGKATKGVIGNIPSSKTNVPALGLKSEILSVVQSNIPVVYKEKNIKAVFKEKIRRHGEFNYYYNQKNEYFVKIRHVHRIFIHVSENLNLNMNSFALGLSNSPIENQERLDLFIKMLYFSSITIATLGYGDIVPITTLARSLTATEVILGVIIIGLFLNSLAQRIGVKSN